MRLKISTVHPLSPFKAWFPIDTLADNVYTIAHLKRTLCARLPVGLIDHNITLVMDDYDLLDDSPVSILRDGDAICIRRIPSGESSSNSLSVTRKRKRSVSTSSESSSSSSSSSSTSSNSSDSISCSDRSSLSSTSSASDSDSDTGVPEPPCRPVEKHAVKSKNSRTNPSLVPPGYGKPSTRNRNLRRRRKRLAERNLSTQEPLAPTSGANAVLPLPIQQTSLTRTSSDAYAADAEQSESQLMMISLRNKNKKKNFRQLMDKPLPPRIVFTELENAPTPSETPDTLAFTSSSTPAKVSASPVKHARLIPPSERNDLPSNIFVTSIDVEEGMRPKKKRRSKETPIAVSYDDESYPADFSLDYGSAEVPAVVSNPDAALHLRAEQQWDLLPKISDMSQVEVGSIVAYKALAINPTTFTPEILTTVACMTCISSSQVTVRPLQRPAQVSFGGLTEETEAEVEDETRSWVDVLAADWRVVR